MSYISDAHCTNSPTTCRHYSVHNADNKGISNENYCLLIKTRQPGTHSIQMCNQKPVTNKTYKRNKLKQLSSCLNRTPACSSFSRRRKQIFPFCVQLLFSQKVNHTLPITG